LLDLGAGPSPTDEGPFPKLEPDRLLT